MSPKLRQQILFILDTWEGRFRTYSNGEPVFAVINSIMRKELGTTKLSSYSSDEIDEFKQWFRAHEEVDDLLDSLEVAVRAAKYYSAERQDGSDERVAAEVAELNARALEDGFGYQIEGEQVIKIGSTYLHKEATVPALNLLAAKEYIYADKEFRQAYDEFRSGNFDDCIHDCCNAFESVLKVILNGKGWAFNPTDTAKKLLAVAFDNGLIPSYMQNEFTGLRTILESGVPTVRNKEGGHGTGVNPRNIPKHIAMFQLHQTAAAIVLLVEAAK
jgi:hypothetical protein